MKTYLLLAIIYAGLGTGGVTTIEREFTSLESCQEAATFINNVDANYRNNNAAKCIEVTK